ncbi:1,4-dihydroxy-2-naphthoate polyprenyltransferase [Alkalibacillus haloalkaliphilus]|uniref:1,4-dihydroxy-2-naphthoate polyprenyltransferase n=1 Tax=Alkalibacillus haloalkaliphilus TaxID=94136 RepID=UPI002935B7AA|nr:1,4-dihydroxy-2-naphthoate polyprenyltransferase [Alkalibacillus haloalkaliphilus]MDV2582132.1 1,4-dihydroxy-2-naphthoate polyprenyltransferase [Alkalibacillus haloalkaliphilus]
MSEDQSVQEALGEKPGFQVWWRMLRPHTLTASFVPVFIGTVAASMYTSIHVGLFLAMLIASMLIQAATNMFNEYYDYVKGLDTEDSVGIGGTIVRDGIPPIQVRNLAFIFYGVAVLLGFYICIETTFWIAVIGLISMLFGYLYTGGPYPIAYSPFGELFAGFFMGTVIIGISYYIQTEAVTTGIILLSIPPAILIGAILLSNNIRDLDNDKESGRKTLAILVGRDNAIRVLAFFFISAYVLTAIFIIIGLIPIWAVITLLSATKAINAYKMFKQNKTPLEMMPGMKFTAQMNTQFGLLYGLSFLLEHLFAWFI